MPLKTVTLGSVNRCFTVPADTDLSAYHKELIAEVRNKGISQDLALKLCVLEVMAWLRKRFVRFSPTPMELQVPEPQDYELLKDGDIRSFHLDLGHTVDVLYAPEEGLWSFRLIELDPGANFGGPNPRLPVAGRSFETNIAVRIVGKDVQVGFYTICSEPQEHKEDCEVFRPVAVKNIANNPLLGLRQAADIRPEPIIVESSTDLQRLQRLVDDPNRDLPMRLITNPPPVDVESAFQDIHSGMIDTAQRFIATSRLDRGIADCIALPSETQVRTSANSKALAQSLIAFAHVAVCCDGQFTNLQQCVPISEFTRGDWLIYYPHDLQLIPASKALGPSYVDRMKEDLKLFPKRRSIDYHDVLFYSDAQIRASASKQRNLAEYGQQLELRDDECQRLRARISELEEEKRDLLASRENKDESRRKLKAEQDRRDHAEQQLQRTQLEVQHKNKTISNKDTEIDFFRRKTIDAVKFPTTFEQIEDWVKDNLADCLVLHSRAVKELKKVKRPIDVSTLCDGVYFLAAHARYLRNEITLEQRSLYQIGYEWDPCPVGKMAVQLNRKDYEIIVNTPVGKREKRIMDEHIKHGSDARLIRVYYLWDSKMQKIIIGSLPDHLRMANPY